MKAPTKQGNFNNNHYEIYIYSPVPKLQAVTAEGFFIRPPGTPPAPVLATKTEGKKKKRHNI